MLKKTTLILLFVFCSQSIFPQAFDYERAWGTYYGPVGNIFNIPASYGGFLLDPQNNLYVSGEVDLNNSLGASHYNQYVTPGGQSVVMNVLGTRLQTKFSNSGTLLHSEYTGYASANSTEEHLVHIDKLGNYYYIKEKLAALNDSTTPNTWFPTDPILSTANNVTHQLLTKKNSSGNIIWKTFLPNIRYSISFTSDESGNFYIFGSTLLQQGITTSGTFMQNYQIKYVSGVIESNAYVAKLGLQGQLLWGTYLPTAGGGGGIEYYNQQLFLMTGADLDANLPQLATPNTWQTNPAGASTSITALNTQTGSRVWGTYIGSASSSGSGGNLKVNSTGIYICGVEFIPGANYFATPGAYKAQSTGATDYFLTKLDFTGNRVWGTYFGSDGLENLVTSNSIALTDHGVFIAGSINGMGSNLATPGSFIDTPPNNDSGSENFFFAHFNLAGNLQWSSYYGGPQLNLGQQYRTINIFAPDHSTFYLYGGTGASTGIATPGAAQPQLPPNIGVYSTGFLARFNYKGELSTSEADQSSDLQLYDNPNNGNFTLKGKLLRKENTQLSISDASGRLIYKQNLPKQETVELRLEDQLTLGVYFLEINGQKSKVIKTFKMVVKK